MAWVGNISTNNTQKIYGEFNIYNGKANYFGQYTLPALSYNVDNCSFINNPYDTPDRIDFGSGASALPLLPDSNSSYQIIIRGGHGQGRNNIINTTAVNYASYNNEAQKPLRVNVGDNTFSNCWVEINRLDNNNNKVHIGTKHFDVKFSTVGNRESFVNGDLIDFSNNNLIFNSNSLPSNSYLFVYNNLYADPIDPETGNYNAAFTGIDTDSISYPYTYQISNNNNYSKELRVTVVNKSNAGDTCTYGVIDYAPFSVIRNSGNFINFKGTVVANDLSQPAGFLIKDGYATDNRYVTVSTSANSASVVLQKTAGNDLFLPFSGSETNFLTAQDFTVTISNNSDGSGDAVSKTFKLNNYFGALPTAGTLSFNQYFGSGDYLSITATPANSGYWALITDPDSGDKIRPVFGNTNIGFHNDYEIYGLNYNLLGDISGVDNPVSATLYDNFLRQVTSGSWFFDNTPPVINSEVSLLTGYGTDIYIEDIENPLVATFAAGASDNSGLEEVSLQLSYDQVNWTNLNMQSAGGNNYTLSLGALSYPWQERDISYRLYLRDIYGNITVSSVNQSDVSISEYSSFTVLNSGKMFTPGQDNINLKAIIGDPGATEIKIVVYDNSNEKIRSLPIPSKKEGFQDYVWDGKDENGNYVKPGTYNLNIYVKGVLEKADLQTTITVFAVEDEKENGCFLSSAGLDNASLKFYRNIRSLCINGELNPGKEQNPFFAVTERGVCFYYKALTPFYKKHLKSKFTDSLIKTIFEI